MRLMRPTESGKRLGRAPAHAPEWSLRLGGLTRTVWVCLPVLHGPLQINFTFLIAMTYGRKGISYSMAASGMKKAHGLLRYGDAIYWMSDTPCGDSYFGLAPPDYADTLYLSYGDPRQVGLSLARVSNDVGFIRSAHARRARVKAPSAKRYQQVKRRKRGQLGRAFAGEYGPVSDGLPSIG